MISIQALQARLPSRFARSQIVREDLLRCEEVDGNGRPFALHYFKPTADLSALADNLRDFQNENIGSGFFDSDGDLRWNHYLYVIADTSAFSGIDSASAKMRIESDRSFARKFVLSESELFDTFEQQERALLDPQKGPSTDIMGRWVERLLAASLDVVLEQKPLAETIRLISDADSLASRAKAQIGSARPHDSVASGFLEELEIRTFRPYPQPGVFHGFGKVNLIHGANGTGKTTLLEAIEFLYCHENARVSPKQSVDIRAVVRGSSGPLPISSAATPAELKARNLHWYGVRDLKGSTLVNSFARYNFIGTDEAVRISLGQGTERDIEDLVSRVVSGPQAADLWGHIVRLKDPLAAELSRQTNRRDRFVAEKHAAEEQLANSASSPGEAEHAFSTFSEAIRRLGWPAPVARSEVDAPLFRDLKRWDSELKDLLSSDWIEGSPSIEWIKAYREDLLERNRQVLTLVKMAEGEKGVIEHEQRELSRAQSNLELIRQFDSIIASGYLDARDRAKSIKDQLDADRRSIGVIDLPISQVAQLVVEDSTLDSQRVEAVEEIADQSRVASELEAQLLALRSGHASVELWRTDIRQLALKLFNHDHSLEKCPVCHTRFDPAELLRRIEDAPGASSTDSLEIVSERLESVRKHLDFLNSKKAVFTALLRYVNARGLEGQGPASLVVADLLATERRVEESAGVLLGIEGDLRLLSAKGIDEVTFAKISEGLTQAGLGVLDSIALLNLLTSLKEEIESKSERLVSLRRQVVDTENAATELVPSVLRELGAPVEKLSSLLAQHLELVNKAVERVTNIALKLVLDDRESVVLIHENISGARRSLDSFLAADANAKRLNTVENESRKKIEAATNDIIQVERSLTRIKAAYEVISDLIVSDSLQSASERELEATRSVCQAIFRSVHTPREYNVNRGLQFPLMRSDTKELVSLLEVSSGQRAAFVLALFLSMNSQLRSGPPVILFDDPIAHVDDLNALSFLDHLRQLVLTDRRQIFYATADSRLAGLFQHKFGFLGPQFKRFDLNRTGAVIG
jgi:exonuclease SbcC